VPSEDGATARMAARIVQPGRSLRPVEDTDGAALIALIGAAYDEFACGPMDPDGFDADLARPATHAERRGRRWWVVIDDTDATLVASIRHTPLVVDARGRHVELQRLYLAPSARGAGLAHALIEGVAEEARRLGAGRLEAWSDTRLVRAHARYVSMGFTVAADTRELHDPAQTTELRFELELIPGTTVSSAAPDGRG
jgi:GNAT superfamily N-acetyltransferase